jgi:predicted GNAT family acetyltransferase
MTATAPEYSVVDAPERERFEIPSGDELSGFTSYRRRGGLIAFTHTEVAPEFEGKGVAGRLVAGALHAARADGLAVLPFCPFVAGYIAKHPDEYVDLVPADQRAHFDLA